MKKIGQITLKKIGKKYAVCISGTPEELFKVYLKAKDFANKLRKKNGRRVYNCKNHKNYK